VVASSEEENVGKKKKSQRGVKIDRTGIDALTKKGESRRPKGKEESGWENAKAQRAGKAPIIRGHGFVPVRTRLALATNEFLEGEGKASQSRETVRERRASENGRGGRIQMKRGSREPGVRHF